MKFVLDTNIFIQASRHYYAFDLVPKFWTNLIDHAGNGELCSIDRVEKELKAGHDQLAQWAKDHPNIFLSSDLDEINNAYRDIIIWVTSQGQFTPAAKADFARGADGWLIAFAKVKSCMIVTHELFDPNIKRKVPIPNVCQLFSIKCIDTYTMLRSLGIQL